MTPILTIIPLLFLVVASIPWLLPHLRTNLRHLLRKPTPQSSQKPSRITSLRVYPIKSCRGFEIQKTKLHMTGLDLDRRWMLVDAESHVFLTIRQIPEMTRIRTGLSDDGEYLLLSVSPTKGGNKGDGGKEIRIPSHPDKSWLEKNTTLATDIEIWDTVTDGYVYNPEIGINQLFSTFLNRSVALVYKGPTPRVLKGNGDPRLLGRVQDTNFPDVHPVLIASEASIDELNGRLKSAGHEGISIERFRPNIIIKGEEGGAWVEDSWKTVRIRSSSSSSGDGKEGGGEGLTFDIVARCGRCQVPNVHPETAEKHRTQPWDTMMKYRRVDEGLKYKPCFGMLGAPRGEGDIRVGMRFEVLEETDRHRYIRGF
ncbi:hypothetical protein BDW59DRAFT_57926 [Aspergillus cavernicola]|uniref:MOSC domain-containing protein n=1 Tax=Aspergillus cavernicola TaxID=176166 RepID=A0ABR4IHA1_9EURO